MKKILGTSALLSLIVMICLSLGLTTPVKARQNKSDFTSLYGEVALDYSNGDYGTSDDTDIFSTSVTVGFSPTADWELYVTAVPFLYQKTTNLISVAGQPVKAKGKRAAQSAQEEERESHTGIGDTTIGATFYAIDETEIGPEVDFTANIKIPTADDDRGLGTGEIDYSVGVNLSKTSDAWTIYGSLDYTILGDPGGDYDLDNYLSGTIGVSHQCLPNLKNSLYVYAGQAMSDESDDQLEIGLNSSINLSEADNLSVYVTRGLWDGSPDWGVGMAFTHVFF